MTKTEYYNQLISIWQGAESRQDAHRKMKTTIDPELTYAQMLHKVNYAKKRGISLKKLERDMVDWGTLCERFTTDSENNE